MKKGMYILLMSIGDNPIKGNRPITKKQYHSLRKHGYFWEYEDYKLKLVKIKPDRWIVCNPIDANKRSKKYLRSGSCW